MKGGNHTERYDANGLKDAVVDDEQPPVDQGAPILAGDHCALQNDGDHDDAHADEGQCACLGQLYNPHTLAA